MYINTMIMENIYQDKINSEVINVIHPIRDRWDEFTEYELEILLLKFGDICRDETSKMRVHILTDKKLVRALLEIGQKYKNNSKILIEIISSFHNMRERYKLEITNAIFDFAVSCISNRKVNFYVSIFIIELPQFENYKYKWKYVLSIPKIAPRKKSINTFYRYINKHLDCIPNDFKSEIIKVLNNALNVYGLHETTIRKYKDIIEKVRNG